MSTKRAYRRTAVKKISPDKLAAASSQSNASIPSVGLDIGKLEIVAVIRWSDGAFDSPWSFQNPSEISELIELRRLEAFQRQSQQWLGRWEGLTTKHWPELSRLLDLSSWTILSSLKEYGGPQRMSVDPADLFRDDFPYNQEAAFLGELQT